MTAAVGAGLRVDALHEHLDDRPRAPRRAAPAGGRRPLPRCASAARCCPCSTRCSPADEPARRIERLRSARRVPARRGGELARPTRWLDAGRPHERRAFDFRGHGASDRAPGHVPDRRTTWRTRSRCWRRRARPCSSGTRSAASSRGRSRSSGPTSSRRCSSRTRRCSWASRTSTRATRRSRRFVAACARSRRAWQAAGVSTERTSTAAAGRPALPDGRSDRRRSRPPRRSAARGYALTHLDLEVLDRVIDGSLLRRDRHDLAGRPCRCSSSPPTTRSARRSRPPTRRGWRRRTRPSRSCAAGREPHDPRRARVSATSTCALLSSRA